MNVPSDDWDVRAYNMDYIRDHDNASFEDSERFEDDSECSFISSEASIIQSWRGWDNGTGSSLLNYHCTSGRYSSASNNTVVPLNRSICTEQKVPLNPSTLLELSAKVCARSLSFEQLELHWKEINRKREEDNSDYLIPSYCIPENLILTIIQYCFPTSMDDIRLYCCLANGNGNEFSNGDHIFSSGAVKNVVQIGYLITAKISPVPQTERATLSFEKPGKEYDVAIQLDRGRIVGCKCTCGKRPPWCLHVVAVCYHRIYRSAEVEYRKPLWDSINELNHEELKKMVQFFIHMVPWEYLSTAQKLLDGLKNHNSEINKSIGVPDPTDGGHDEVPRWTFSEQDVHIKIRKLLQVFCMPSPTVYPDIRAMSSPIYSQHPIAQEWRTLRKCMRAREPEGLWNLIFIVKEMFSRRDSNAMSVLRIMTEECLANSQVLIWWYLTRLLHTNEWVQYCPTKNESGENSNQINACLLMEEIVSLWKTSSLDPTLSDENKSQLFTFLQNYHRLAVKRIWKLIKNNEVDVTGQNSSILSVFSKRGQSEYSLTLQTAKFTMKEFPGFHPALHACWTLPKLRVSQLDDIPSSSSIITDWTIDTCIPLQFGNSPSFQSTSKNRRAPRPIGRTARRVSPDEESSESGQESEHDAASGNDASRGFPQEELDSVLAASYLAMEPLEMRFIKCEALYAHGYHQEAIHLAIDIARTLRLHMPGIEESSSAEQLGNSSEIDGENTVKEFKVNTERSAQTLDCLEKAFTIAQILRGHNDSFLFSFILGILFAPKQPMSNKLNQFREHHIECELLDIMRSIPIGDAELEKLRKACHLMCNNRDKQNPTVPHIALPHFIYKSLSHAFNNREIDQPSNSRVRDVRCNRDPSDDDLCLQVALDALSSKLLVPEDEFPMLCEVIRRQKGDLCIDLLTTYKDSREKIALVMDRYLDPHYHKMYSQHASNAAFFLKRDSQLNTETRSNTLRRPPYPLHENNYYTEEEHPCPRPSKTGIKRWRLKKIEYPTEAHAQYMTELSKRIVEEAGGNQNPVVFAPLGANAAQGPHRNLRMCGILISLYGLGLHNKVSPSWRTRTYNTITSWINGQALEVGAPAIEMIRELWVGHFTATEIASLADKASSESRDPTVLKEAAALALSVLPYAEKLSSTEISKALMQCKEQNIAMLESACLALKEVYSKHKLPPSTLWQVAHHWEDLYNDQHAKQKKQLLQQQSQGAGNPMPLHSGMQQHSNILIPPPQHYNISQPMQNLHIQHYHPNMHNMQYVNYNQNSMITNVPSGPMPLIPSLKPPGLHQSHSAPQLSSVPTQQPGEPDMRLVLAAQAGIRAIESIGSNSNSEDSRTRYAVTSIHTPDIQWLFSLSLKLGPYYTSNFLEYCANHLSSPFTLYSLGIESMNLDKQFKLLPQLIYGQISQSAPSKQFHQNYGQVRNAMSAHYHPLTAELFERAVEQFFVSITTKLNFSRFNSSDREDATRLLQAAYEALHCVPGAGRTIFEDLCRQAKKQKSGKREMASVINELLKRNPSFHYPPSSYA